MRAVQFFIIFQLNKVLFQDTFAFPLKDIYLWFYCSSSLTQDEGWKRWRRCTRRRGNKNSVNICTSFSNPTLIPPSLWKNDLCKHSNFLAWGRKGKRKKSKPVKFSDLWSNKRCFLTSIRTRIMQLTKNKILFLPTINPIWKWWVCKRKKWCECERHRQIYTRITGITFYIIT